MAIKPVGKNVKTLLEIGFGGRKWRKSAGIATDISEDTIRNYALQHDLVDVKVCAVSELWSGLKLVVRKEKK